MSYRSGVAVPSSRPRMVKRPTSAASRICSTKLRSTAGKVNGSIAAPMPVFATIQPPPNARTTSASIAAVRSPRARCAIALFAKFHAEHLRPQLARDQECLIRGIVRDPVEHVDALPLEGREQIG